MAGKKKPKMLAKASLVIVDWIAEDLQDIDLSDCEKLSALIAALQAVYSEQCPILQPAKAKR